ncbi:MAG: DNA-binding MarR family transcriptional regulator [Salibacteraceae bacterium]|jgi:DNA-binding MarR family transcriptional regulator
MKSSETFDFHIRWAWYKISRLYNSIAQEHGVNMSVGYALLKIDPENGTPSTKLGPLMGMESRSLTRTLKAMQADNLIEKKTDELDKRVIRIMLTDFGVEQREIAKKVVIDFNTIIDGKLTEVEKENFFSSIGKINEVLESELFRKRKK